VDADAAVVAAAMRSVLLSTWLRCGIWYLTHSNFGG
jgi:hypothetical protein